MMGNIMIYIYSYAYSHMPSCLLNRRNERGATMVEYAILVALISVAAIVIIAVLGGQINEAFTNVSDQMNATMP
jgi:pilus assembly protein Flp/PilA